MTFDQVPYYAWFPKPQQGNDSDNSNQTSAEENSYPRYIILYYSTADEITFTSNLLVDLPTFISSTGGNLGLFVGFSFMGILFSLYEWIEKKVSRAQPH